MKTEDLRGGGIIKNDIVEELFTKYYNELLLYTLSLCRDKSTAEDVVSEAFFKALLNADGSVRDFKLWLLSVCRNEYFSRCRKKKRRPVIQSLDETEASSEDVLMRVIRDEEYRALYRAIGLLSDDQREVIVLFYFSSLSVRAVSEIIGQNEGNVKVLLHRARKKLKKILEVTK